MRMRRQEDVDVSTMCLLLEQDSVAVLGRLSAASSDAQRFLIGPLFARAIDLFRSIRLLVEREHGPAARVVCRSLLETSFIIGAIRADSNVSQQYLLASQRQEVKCARMRKAAGSVGQEDIPLELHERTLSSMIFLWATKAPTGRALAEKAELDMLYGLYCDLCRTVHSTSHDVMPDHADFECDDVIGSCHLGSVRPSPDLLLACAASAVIASCRIVTELFDISDSLIGDRHADFIDVFMRLARAPEDEAPN